MKCKNCGNEISKNDVFCQHCGAKQSEVVDSIICPECGEANEKDCGFCVNCGASLSNSKPKEKKKTKKVIEEKVEEEIVVETPSIKEEIGDTTRINPIVSEPKNKSYLIPIIIVSVVGFIAICVVGYFFFFRNFFTSNKVIKSKETVNEVQEDTNTVVDEKKEEAPSTVEQPKENTEIVSTHQYYSLEALDNVRVRSFPDTKEDNQVGKIAKGSTIRAYDIKQGDDGLTWYLINDGEWAANDGSFFKVEKSSDNGSIKYPSNPIGKLNVIKDTLIYKGPSKDSGTVGWLTESTKLLYYDKLSKDGETWVQISCEGYVLSSNVEDHNE